MQLQAHLAILVFQGVMYQFSYRNRTCIKRPLKVDFQPLEVPKNASLMGQVVLGASSGPGQGVLVNSWAGEVSSGPAKGTVRIIRAEGSQKRSNMTQHMTCCDFFFFFKNLLNRLHFFRQLVICLLPQQNT